MEVPEQILAGERVAEHVRAASDAGDVLRFDLAGGAPTASSGGVVDPALARLALAPFLASATMRSSLGGRRSVAVTPGPAQTWLCFEQPTLGVVEGTRGALFLTASAAADHLASVLREGVQAGTISEQTYTEELRHMRQEALAEYL